MSDITDSTCISIVTEYLLNNCYKNTAKALQFETNKLAARSEDLSEAPVKNNNSMEEEEDEKPRALADGVAEDMDTEEDDPSWRLLDARKDIYDSILMGNIDRATQTIRLNFPIMTQVTPAAEEPTYFEILMYKLACQQFVEIVRSGDEIEAITFAQTNLGTQHQSLRDIIDRVSPLIAYPDPAKSTSSYLFNNEHRQGLADEVNVAVLTLSGLSTETALEKLSKQHKVVNDTLDQINTGDQTKEANSARKMSM
ncbi:CTLH/CRA C-terminal to lish motif domain-containing protein [Phycomyces nitens]|nr:CTLH/CRA C-terminal to lish motif domain-containing protein [Phycomyces nitens]